MTEEELHCRCNHCDQHLSAPAPEAGQEVVCPRCGLDTVLYVAPPEPPAPPPPKLAAAEPEVFRCACPECGQAMSFPAEWAGSEAGARHARPECGCRGIWW